MRISYIHGPGNAYGTFLQWKAGNDDSSIIKQTYSGQFFDLVSELGAQAQLVCTAECGESGDDRFRFSKVRRAKARGWRHYLADLEYAREVGRNVRDFDPDLLIISSDFPSIFYDLLPRKPEKIISMHNTFWDPYEAPKGIKERTLNLVRKWSLRDTNFAVCVSKECQAQYRAVKGRSDAYSVVQIPRVPAGDDGMGESPSGEARSILYVGRIVKVKGVEELIRAFLNVRKRHGSISLTVVGDGSHLEACRRLSAELGGEDAITFTGRLDSRGVQAAYRSADLCVCPTRSSFCEGLATVPIEAAGYGVPSVISSAVPAREYFRFQDLVFRAGSAEDLERKIDLAVSSKEVYAAAAEDARLSFVSVMTEVEDWKSGITRCISRM